MPPEEDAETNVAEEVTEAETPAISREERVTGAVPVEEKLDPNSREFHAKHGWPDETEGD